jgi:hypothetical protein
VLLGWAPPELLSTYEAERRPAAAHNVARSADPAGSRRDAMSELQVDLGGRIAHAWLEASPSGEARRSTIDLVGPGLSLLTGPKSHAAHDGPARMGRPPITTTSLPHSAARALGLGPAGAVLLRPDGVPVASWSAADVPRSDIDRAIDAFVSPTPTNTLTTRRTA